MRVEVRHTRVTLSADATHLLVEGKHVHDFRYQNGSQYQATKRGEHSADSANGGEGIASALVFVFLG
jgi:hypothetical protein